MVQDIFQEHSPMTEMCPHQKPSPACFSTGGASRSFIKEILIYTETLKHRTANYCNCCWKAALWLSEQRWIIWRKPVNNRQVLNLLEAKNQIDEPPQPASQKDSDLRHRYWFCPRKHVFKSQSWLIHIGGLREVSYPSGSVMKSQFSPITTMQGAF